MKRLEYLDHADCKDLDDIEILEKLRRRLNDSRTEMYCGLKYVRGADCSFVRKSLEKFEEYDLEDIRSIILVAAERMKKYGRGR